MKKLFDIHFWINTLISAIYASYLLYSTWNMPDGNIIILIYLSVPVILHIGFIVMVYNLLLKKVNKITNAIAGVFFTIVLILIFIKCVEVYREKTIGGGHPVIIKEK